jgi:hypothetical protein
MGLQQGFATTGMGSNRHFAWQQSSRPNVRFGSKADIEAGPLNVRFTPESGHSNRAKCGVRYAARHSEVDHPK